MRCIKVRTPTSVTDTMPEGLSKEEKTAWISKIKELTAIQDKDFKAKNKSAQDMEALKIKVVRRFDIFPLSNENVHL